MFKTVSILAPNRSVTPTRWPFTLMSRQMDLASFVLGMGLAFRQERAAGEGSLEPRLHRPRSGLISRGTKKPGTGSRRGRGGGAVTDVVLLLYTAVAGELTARGQNAASACQVRFTQNSASTRGALLFSCHLVH